MLNSILNGVGPQKLFLIRLRSQGTCWELLLWSCFCWSLSGGQGSVLGTALGAFIVGMFNNGLVIMCADPFLQKVIKGFVILLAVIVNRLNPGE